MKYEIDQSGKVEDTSCHTVVGFSNSTYRTILLLAREKRKLQEIFRLHGQPRLYVDVTFAILVFILIKPIIKQRPTLIIDIEYPGHTKIIEGIIHNHISTDIELHWKLIGKSSKVHDITYKTFKKKLRSSKVINSKEIWILAKKYAGGRLNSGLSPENRRSAPAIETILTKRVSKVNIKKTNRKSR